MRPRHVRFLKAALSEITDGFEWYDAQKVGLGHAFLADVDRAIHRITAWPLSCPEVAPYVRRCLMGRFPYGVVYGCDGDTIVVIAMAHVRREPRYWVKRLAQL